MTADELGLEVRKHLDKWRSPIDVSLEFVRDAGLGYPLGAENGRVVSWWGHHAFEAWCRKYRVIPLPLKVSDTSVTFFSK